MMRRAGALGWPGLATTSFAPLDAGGRSRRPRSVAATAGVRLGMRAARKAAACMIVGQGGSVSSYFTGMPTRSLHARGAVCARR